MRAAYDVKRKLEKNKDLEITELQKGRKIQGLRIIQLQQECALAKQNLVVANHNLVLAKQDLADANDDLREKNYTLNLCREAVSWNMNKNIKAQGKLRKIFKGRSNNTVSSQTRASR